MSRSLDSSAKSDMMVSSSDNLPFLSRSPSRYIFHNLKCSIADHLMMMMGELVAPPDLTRWLHTEAQSNL